MYIAKLTLHFRSTFQGFKILRDKIFQKMRYSQYIFSKFYVYPEIRRKIFLNFIRSVYKLIIFLMFGEQFEFETSFIFDLQ